MHFGGIDKRLPWAIGILNQFQCFLKVPNGCQVIRMAGLIRKFRKRFFFSGRVKLSLSNVHVVLVVFMTFCHLGRLDNQTTRQPDYWTTANMDLRPIFVKLLNKKF